MKIFYLNLNDIETKAFFKKPRIIQIRNEICHFLEESQNEGV